MKRENVNGVLTIMATLLLGTLGNVAHAAENGAVNVTATIAQPPCNLSVTPATVALGSIDPTSLVGQNQVLINNSLGAKAEIAVALTCPMPKTGTPTVTVGGTALSTAEPKLFKDTTSTSIGFGVGLAKLAKTGDTPAWANLVGKGDTFTLQPGATQLLSAAVGCGATADCASTNLGAGSLAANVTFTFAYH